MTPITNLNTIASDYDAFIIDLWGVMHDGTTLYPGAKQAIHWLHQQRKDVLFLSNAPRKSARAEAKLIELGIPREQFVDVITSGQVGADMLEQTNQFGTHYYYLGPSKDEDVLDGLINYHKSDIKAADFILNTGFEYDYQPESEIEPLLHQLLQRKLPLICVNPDMEVVKQDGSQLLCAGWVAARYQALGGEVTYIGKPYPHVYETCFRTLGPDKRMLAIGDNVLTDIRGANAAGMDSLLITGGIMRSEKGEYPSQQEVQRLCRATGVSPAYVAALFCVADA